MFKLTISFILLAFSVSLNAAKSCNECEGKIKTKKENVMLKSVSTNTLKILTTKGLEKESKLSTDATPDFGGQEGQLTPGDLLATSLSSCMMINMKSSMLKREIQSDFKSSHSLKIEKDKSDIKFDIDLNFTTNSPKKYEKLLLQMIDACPYKKALNSNVKLNINLSFY